ncbi:hypothetical protein QJS10_CPA06g01132 [Acorus calamus]|uniref:Uncharacterized protein n=1 Tax=Acorus calamus TaxID=4465 RepID=A0AAV9EKZ5_ACOCL|nr:hypothetical protein QJS10_CPA06g01132 [Acorus calamus]
MEEHGHIYHDPYQQAATSGFADSQQSTYPGLNQQHLPVSAGSSPRPVMNHAQESSFTSSIPSSFYVADGHANIGARGGSLTADTNSNSSPQANRQMVPSNYQQEVSSSYSYMPAGRRQAGPQNGSFALPPIVPGHEQLHSKLTLPVCGQSVSVEQQDYSRGNLYSESNSDLSDRPLEFEKRPTLDPDPRMQAGHAYFDPAGSVRGVDHIRATSSVHAWTPPIAPGVFSSPISPVPSGTQFDASFIPPTAMPLHPGTNFGRIYGPNFQPVTAPFGMGTGVPLHPAAAFPGEANGAYSLSERPKKASVPNWLREEIIKKKAVIASSIQDNPTEDDYQSLEIGNTDKSSRKVDQADSNRSNEDDDNEEDIETTRTAAINQEIKRVLTEILLKVTDELFDEIATKVVSEDDPDDQVIKSAKVKVSLPPVPTTPRTSVQVSVPAIVKDTRADGDDESSNPSSPGNLLGLANYASDDEENESSVMQSNRSKNDITSEQVLKESYSNAINGMETENSQPDETQQHGGEKDDRSDISRAGPAMASENRSASLSIVHGKMESITPAARTVYHQENAKSPNASRGDLGSHKDEVLSSSMKVKHSQGFIDTNVSEGKTVGAIPERMCVKSVDGISAMVDSQIGEARTMSDASNGHQSRESIIQKDIVGEKQSSVVKADQKYSDGRRTEDKSLMKGNKNERNSYDLGVKQVENERQPESKKGSNHEVVKDNRQDSGKDKRTVSKVDNDRKRERPRGEKEGLSVQRVGRDSQNSKVHRSPSPGSRGISKRDNSIGSRGSGSGDESSKNARTRKPHSHKRNLSPSPSRGQKRQVSRSPHRKHSQRRHSPFPSHEVRSRSSTPSRRRR